MCESKYRVDRVTFCYIIVNENMIFSLVVLEILKYTREERSVNSEDLHYIEEICNKY